jgi:hypothetical protein
MKMEEIDERQFYDPHRDILQTVSRNDFGTDTGPDYCISITMAT